MGDSAVQFGNDELDFDFDFEHVLDDYFGELVSGGDGLYNPFKQQEEVKQQQQSAAAAAGSSGSGQNNTLRLVEPGITDSLAANQSTMMMTDTKDSVSGRKRSYSNYNTITTGQPVMQTSQQPAFVTSATQIQVMSNAGAVRQPASQPAMLPASQPQGMQPIMAPQHFAPPQQPMAAPPQPQLPQQQLQPSTSSGNDSVGNSQAPNLTNAIREPEHKSKQQKILEKNRKAQKRFRERQKARTQQLEETVEALTQELAALKTQTSSLTNQRDLLQKLVELRDGQIRSLQGNDDQELSDIQFDDPISGVVSGCDEARQPFPELKLSKAQIKKMSHEEVGRYWKSLVEQLTPLLVQVEGPQCDPQAVTRVEQLVNVAGRFCASACLLNPFSIKRVVSCNLESWEWVDKNEDHYKQWFPLVEYLQLTQSQRQKILQMYDKTVDRQRKSRQERINLHRVFMEEFDLGSMQPKDMSIKERNIQSMKMHQAALDLKRNLEETHVMYGDFIGGTLFGVLGKMQLARLIVRFWPYYPDAFTLATCLKYQQMYLANAAQGAAAPTYPGGDAYATMQRMTEAAKSK